MSKRLLLTDILQGTKTFDYTSDPISLDDAAGFALVSVATDVTPANTEFESDDVSFALSLIVINTHAMETGLRVKFTTTGTLPSGLTVGVEYYVIRNTENIIRLATSLDNAKNMTYLTLADAGVGTHTISPVIGTKPTIHLEATIDGTVWAKITNSVHPISSIPVMIEHEAAYYHKVRSIITIEYGQYLINSKIMVRGEPI